MIEFLIHTLGMKASLLTVGMIHQRNALFNIQGRHFRTASTMHQAHQVTQRQLQSHLPKPWGLRRRLTSCHSKGNGRMHSLMRLRSFISCCKKLLIHVILFNGGQGNRHSSPTSLIWQETFLPSQVRALIYVKFSISNLSPTEYSIRFCHCC